MSSFFFFGTLLVPSVLLRVIESDGSHLTFLPAVLDKTHVRVPVKGEDYPALVTTRQAVEIGARGPLSEPASVRGVVAHGLTAQDVSKLAVFEGDEYAPGVVEVAPLADKALPLDQQPNLLAEGLTKAEGKEKVRCTTFVWVGQLARLEPGEWDFQSFLADKSHLWSAVSSTSDATHPAPPAFGKSLLKYFMFDEDYVNLNHGSYGSVPRPVMAYCRKLSDECEGNADRFMRRSYLPLLTDVRKRLANLCKTDLGSVVLVPNATHGVGTVTSNIVWEQDDIILAYSTSYGAILQTLRALCDSHTRINLTVVVIPLTFPTSHAEIVRLTEQAIVANGGVKTKRGRVRMVIADGIASNPGQVLPWREIARVAREYDVLSCIDGAHLIGQVPLDLSDDDCCDFLITNCHKWLMSHRGGAMLWVPKRNQHLIRTSFPTSFDYESTLYPGTGKGAWSFANQFDWTGTQDWVPFLSISAALDFRAFLGGEDRIMEHNHALAVEGGKHLQKMFGGTAIMENEKGELTAGMVNVALPAFPLAEDKPTRLAYQRFIEDSLFAANAFAAVFVHGDHAWVRCSAQVWNEISDFEYVGKVLIRICDQLRDGSWKTVEFS